MDWTKCLEIIERTISILGFIVILYGIYFYWKSIKKNRFDVINTLSVRFESIMFKLAQSGDNQEIKRHAIRLYFFLCEEEIYHINKGSIPSTIARAWVHAMIDLIPNVNHNEDDKILKYLSQEGRQELKLKKLMKYCPNVRDLFYYTSFYESNPDNIISMIKKLKL